ncbi:MAG: hypothetical protein HDR80_00465 [Bacteroides sp.]|nr:hypothetical protein [Bacteroides sp.]
MGIYNESGRLLGYIPADELDSYRRWCDGQPQPCVGIIYTDEDYLCGRVKILRPCNPKFLQDEFSKYLQWIHDNYGRSYLPKKLSMQFETE